MYFISSDKILEYFYTQYIYHYYNRSPKRDVNTNNIKYFEAGSYGICVHEHVKVEIIAERKSK